ncbi:ETX/MTX2 family pore-forming toxin [Spiroplasma endosymbiont of Megaselia nigra]|uniref:ETX/MTX2 family pore-forming toxin n=1 Tax=Spiroplasma endosymbiont of Megaselia nigra TaxID=2478537 RepID=UPI000F87791A|nr:ETX/MTX2 family pore-forming toxin [Spiroplasma endosymbiont of Megaselia nigra]RUO85953.1 hypothetical protein D9R21_05865 [Spiroplasma endosymbiont of Megaselia nigra]
MNDKLYFAKGKKLYEYEPLELIENRNIYLEEQIYKALYLHYKKHNPDFEFKTILNINMENLIVSNFTLNEIQLNKSSNLLEDLTEICKDSNSTLINNNDIEQNQNTISCSQQITETNTIQKINGFSKSKTTANTENWSWNINTKVTAKASGSAGIIPIVNEGKVEVGVEVGSGYTWGESKTYTIGDTSTSSETEIKTTTSTTTITIPSYSVKVPPHSKIITSTKTWKNNIVIILSGFQKVEGKIYGKIIDRNNNEIPISLSVKQAMLNLLENEILPSKIVINNDNSINFSYDVKNKKKIIMHESIIGKSIPLN